MPHYKALALAAFLALAKEGESELRGYHRNRDEASFMMQTENEAPLFSKEKMTGAVSSLGASLNTFNELLSANPEESKSFNFESEIEEDSSSSDSIDTQSPENILEAMKYLNQIVNSPDTEESSYSDIEEGFKYVGEYIEKLEGGELKEKFEDALASMYGKFEDKKNAFEEESSEDNYGNEGSSSDKEDKDEVKADTPEDILEAMKYLNNIVQDPDTKESSFAEIDDGFKFIAETIEKMDVGKTKDKFEEALVAMYKNFDEKKKSSEKVAFEEEPAVVEDVLDERLNMMLEINKSFDIVQELANNMEINDENVKQLKDLSGKMEAMAPVFVEIKNSFEEKKPDENILSSYINTLKRYDGIIGSLSNKLEESIALADTKEADVDKMEHKNMNIEPLVSMLSDIQNDIKTGEDLDGINAELMYVESQIAMMDSNDENVDKLAEVTNLLKGMVAEKKEVSLAEEPASEDGSAELAKVMSQLGFPESKIDQVKSILMNEGGAYEINEEEKKEMKEDESDF